MRVPASIRVLVALVAGLALIVGFTAPAASAQVPPLPDLPIDVPDLPVDPGDLPVDVPGLPDVGALTAILDCLPAGGLLPVGGLLEADAAQVDALVEALLCVISTAVELLSSALAGLPAPDLPAAPLPLP